MKRNFTSWSKTELYKVLGISLSKDCSHLSDWIKSANNQSINDFEQSYLKWLLENSIDYIDNWNEAELRDQFISNITTLIKFNSNKHLIGVFAERILSATVNDVELSGKIDWMVASGLDVPEQPFFFIHEYKKEEGNSSVSGRAQLYAIMRTAKELNKDKDKPIYGCYVLGRFWFFTTLVGNHYCITDAYTATRIEELRTIVKILKAQKTIIFNSVVSKND